MPGLHEASQFGGVLPRAEGYEARGIGQRLLGLLPLDCPPRRPATSSSVGSRPSSARPIVGAGHLAIFSPIARQPYGAPFPTALPIACLPTTWLLENLQPRSGSNFRRPSSILVALLDEILEGHPIPLYFLAPIHEPQFFSGACARLGVPSLSPLGELPSSA